jgi:hypothetical protein
VIHNLPPAFADEIGEIRHDFQILNNAGSKAVINEVSRSCGCAKAEIDAPEIAPGATACVHLIANLKGKTGLQQLMWRLASDNGKNWEIGLRVMIFDRAGFVPESPTFGVVNPNSEVATDVSFYTCALPGNKPGEIVAVESLSKEIAVNMGPSTVEALPSGALRRTTSLQLRLQAQCASGLGSSDAVVTFTDQGKPHQRPLHVRWNVKSLFVLSPARAFFGGIGKSAEPMERHIRLEREDGLPLTIRSIKSPSQALLAKATIGQPKTSHEIELVLQPAKVDGAIADEVAVETDHPNQRIIKIPFGAFRRTSESE